MCLGHPARLTGTHGSHMAPFKKKNTLVLNQWQMKVVYSTLPHHDVPHPDLESTSGSIRSFAKDNREYPKFNYRDLHGY